MPITVLGGAAPNLRPTPTSVSQEQLDTVQVLGTTTQSRSLKPSGDAIRASAAAAAALRLTTTDNDFNPARSRAWYEAQNAQVAAQAVETRTVEGPISKGRNADLSALTDTLSGAVTGSKAKLDQVMTLISVSPRTKKQRTLKLVQENINSTLIEVTCLQTLSEGKFGTRLEKRLEETMDSLESLYDERASLKAREKSKEAVKTNLSQAINVFDDE
mmetsp:Transcript_25220/g.39604  ORF Transcript_25220/g.39604 Transcript_25220/m.39604 type:complete len:216 (+) Transcript_25220:3-650(+)